MITIPFQNSKRNVDVGGFKIKINRDWFWDRDWDWFSVRANRLERGEPMGGKPRMANERLRTRTRSLGLCSGIDIASYRNGLGFSRRLIASKKDMRICVYPVQTKCQPRFLPFSSLFFAGCLVRVRTLACLFYEFTTSA